MADLQQVFARVRPLFARHEGLAVVVRDEPGAYYLGTQEVRAKDGYRTQLGGVEVKKNYVSVHLMPVYVHPEMLEEVGGALKKRMQGKSCFNFKAIDDDLIQELDTLIDAGVRRFSEDGKL